MIKKIIKNSNKLLLIISTIFIVACGEDKQSVNQVSSALGNSIIEEVNNQNICESYKDCTEKLGQDWITQSGGYKNRAHLKIQNFF